MPPPFLLDLSCRREDKHHVAVAKFGLYEQILDEATQAAIAELDPDQFSVSTRPLDAGDSHSYLV